MVLMDLLHVMLELDCLLGGLSVHLFVRLQYGCSLNSASKMPTAAQTAELEAGEGSLGRV